MPGKFWSIYREILLRRSEYGAFRRKQLIILMRVITANGRIERGKAISRS